MKKRLSALFLALTALLALTLAPVQAAGSVYGQVPIYIGFSDVDYMADEILKEIPTQGKSAEDQIRAVYDWIIQNCERYEWDGTYYFDEAAVSANAQGPYYQQVSDKIERGEILIRATPDTGIDPYEDISLFYDDEYSVASAAYEIMLTRTGNCVNYSSLLAVLLGHLGFDCRMVAGEFINRDGSHVEHKWNYVLVDGKYYWLDVRMDHATYARTGKVDHRYFMVADTGKWEQNHAWVHTYSDWLAGNAATVAEDYAAQAAVNSGRPWDRCSDWARQQIEQAQQRELLPDCLAGRDLTQKITRSEYCHLVIQACEKLLDTSIDDYAASKGKSLSNPFTDTQDQALVAAYALGITTGTSDTKFSPNRPLTREQGAVMLRNAFTNVVETEPLTAEISSFSDFAKISDWAIPGVEFVCAKKVMNGFPDGRFGPQDGYTREQAIVTLNSMYSKAEH